VPRIFVGLTAVLLMSITIACSDATDPTVTRQLDAAVSATTSTIPFLPNTHVAVITALDGTIFTPTAINDGAEVVGWGNGGSGTSDQAFKWKSDFGLTILGNGSEEDSLSSIAVSVNNKGQVLLQGTSARVAIWNWQGDLRYLRPLSSNPTCTPYAINDAGAALGTCVDGTQLLATGWTPFGTPDALFINGGSTPLATANQFPVALSDSGYVSGSLPNQTRTGFVFTPSKQLVMLASPNLSGITVVLPSVVNNHGQAAGVVHLLGGSGCFQHALVWLSASQVTDLGCGNAAGITDDGMVFVNVGNSTNSVSTAAVWTPATGFHRLPGLEGGAALNEEQSVVIAINHSRQAVGSIRTSTGVTHQVIWTLPAP
jgi:hypothetical protein